jgi:Fibronectin type-III domain
MNPGLVYDISVADYVNFLCNLNYTQQNIRTITRQPLDCSIARRAGHVGSLNYPSFSSTFMVDGGKEKFKSYFARTVTNVGRPGVYKAVIVAPEGSMLKVEPTDLFSGEQGRS